MDVVTPWSQVFICQVKNLVNTGRKIDGKYHK